MWYLLWVNAESHSYSKVTVTTMTFTTQPFLGGTAYICNKALVLSTPIENTCAGMYLVNFYIAININSCHWRTVSQPKVLTFNMCKGISAAFQPPVTTSIQPPLMSFSATVASVHLVTPPWVILKQGIIWHYNSLLLWRCFWHFSWSPKIWRITAECNPWWVFDLCFNICT